MVEGNGFQGGGKAAGMIRLDHFGLHRVDGGIPILVQQGRVDHVLGIHMTFEVQVNHRRVCTHNIDLEDACNHSLLERFADDPLLQAMLPLPRKDRKPLFLEETPTTRAVMAELTRLTSPGTYNIMVPFWAQKPHVIGRMLEETNIQPLILHGFRLDHGQALSRVMAAAEFSPRQLIIFGQRQSTPTVGLAKRIETALTPEDIEHVPLEAVGAWALREHMLSTT